MGRVVSGSCGTPEYISIDRPVSVRPLRLAAKSRRSQTARKAQGVHTGVVDLPGFARVFGFQDTSVVP